ncbi:hypothetical protein Lmor_2987 [Legionella moravica]|uniref:Pyrroloquinoline quinone (Coenzyme PQQ) biosynthesis protein C n=1 Tax=Legionella moravica TaxID=39962 RepID=A0A378JXB1_9GAMM|nr:MULTISPECIES: hypothetical protein [Legionella]KTD30880.1 hypothetical protein Lmor_2987 [Legionella moravica]STX63293.1 Uncharacterised protein [Legionella moravica]
MKTIQAYIDSKQNEFVNHPFFSVLEDLNSLEEISYFVPELTFWAMTFQDILRINEERVKDPYLKKVARHHRLEDAGHEKWFLSDKKYMSEFCSDKFCDRDDVAWLYSKDSQLIRDAAYAIMSEIYKLDDERLNVALLLTLESSGHVFFEKVVKQVKKTGEDRNLKYFSSSHLEVELAHALFEEEMEKKIFEVQLPISTRREALKMIDRCYDAFNKMFDGLVLACNKRLGQAQERNQHVIQPVEYRENQAI